MSNKSISTCFGTYKLQNELKSHDAEYEGHCLTTHKSKQSPAGCTQTCCKKFLNLFCTVYCGGRGCIAVCWSLNIGVFNF